jgi:hypothetical protein
MMIKAVAGRAAGTGLVALALVTGYRTLTRHAAPNAEAHPSFLYGRITAVDGTTYEGRLRFGGTQEAFWGDYFNGFRDSNPWAAHLPSDRLPRERSDVEILGFTIWRHERRIDLRRPFMARFGDIARIEARGRDLTVTLKSGSVVHLDRYAADDFADGLRVWDDQHGVVDLDERKIRSIDFLAPARSGASAPHRLYGTVRTQQGDFTGFLEWDREAAVGADVLAGRTVDGELLSLPFSTVRSIARRSRNSSVATLLDGRDIVLSDTRQVGDGHRGIYVDDPRYGRVLISWDTFERVDLGAIEDSPGGSGPAYGDFPPGAPLAGVITTRSGRRLAGQLVYDLDESEMIETLDAPYLGVDYTIPFGLVASIVLHGGGEDDAGRARVALRSGEVLRLERSGDLGDGNAGLLIFVDGAEHPEYVPWSEVERLDFDRPRAMYPPLARR